jgi:hypothetical protein
MAMYPCLSLPSLSFPTLTGSIVTFNSQYAGLPLKSHTVDIDSVSGVSAINIGNSIAYDTNIEQGTLDNSGLNSYAVNRIRTADYIPVVSGHTYKITLKGSGAYYLGVSGYTANDYATARTQSTAWLGNNTDLLIDAGIKYIRINVRFMDSTVITPADLTGILVTDITNYSTIQIGSTVNEGVYNARTGVLEVTQPSVQTLQLAPCPIDTLEGVNNIWADTGDTTLQYPKFG